MLRAVSTMNVRLYIILVVVGVISLAAALSVWRSRTATHGYISARSAHNERAAAAAGERTEVADSTGRTGAAVQPRHALAATGPALASPADSRQPGDTQPEQSRRDAATNPTTAGAVVAGPQDVSGADAAARTACEKPEKKAAMTNCPTNATDLALAAWLQQELINTSAGSNDLVVRLDNSVDGAQLNAAGNEVRVNARQLNSDVFDSAFANAAGLWLIGLDNVQRHDLWLQYGDRLFSIPGVADYLLRETSAPRTADFVEQKISILADALALNPTSPLLSALLAKAYASDLGNVEKAVGIIDKWAANDAAVEKNYCLAEVYRLAGSHAANSDRAGALSDQALALYESALQNTASPDVARDASLAAATIYRARGDQAKAINTLESSYWKYSGSASTPRATQDGVALEIGTYYLQKQDGYKAIDWYDRCQPAWNIEHGKAQAYLVLGDVDKGIACYQSSIAGNANDITLKAELGTLYARQGDVAKCQQLYRDAQQKLSTMPKKMQTFWKATSAYREFERRNQMLTP